jgi:hypothetical protein
MASFPLDENFAMLGSRNATLKRSVVIDMHEVPRRTGPAGW